MTSHTAIAAQVITQLLREDRITDGARYRGLYQAAKQLLADREAVHGWDAAKAWMRSWSARHLSPVEQWVVAAATGDGRIESYETAVRAARDCIPYMTDTEIRMIPNVMYADHTDDGVTTRADARAALLSLVEEALGADKAARVASLTEPTSW